MSATTAPAPQPSTLRLANSVVRLERGPAGTIVRVDHVEDGRDYAGPVPDSTVRALRRTARGVR